MRCEHCGAEIPTIPKRTRPAIGTVSETEDAIERSEAGADPEWKEKAMEVLVTIASKQKTLTSADLRDAMDRETEETHDLRAIGPMMRRGAKLGIIRNTGERTFARHTHGLLYVVWESLIYCEV